MRMKGRDGISRALYVTARGKRVVVVRVFVKKTQRTPGPIRKGEKGELVVYANTIIRTEIDD